MKEFYEDVEGQIQRAWHRFGGEHPTVNLAPPERLESEYPSRVVEIRMLDGTDPPWLRYTIWPGGSLVAYDADTPHAQVGADGVVVTEDSEGWHQPVPQRAGGLTWLKVGMDLELFLPKQERPTSYERGTD